MGWKTIGIPPTVKITHKLAIKYRDFNRFPGERPLSKTRMEHIRDEIDAGCMRTFDWGLAYCEETQQWYRVNGQNSSTVFADMDSIPSGALATLSDYRCPTMQDVARLYSTFDSKKSSRTNSDINASVQSTLDLSDVSHKVVNLAVTGMNYSHFFRSETCLPIDRKSVFKVANGDIKQSLTAIEKSELLLGNEAFVRFLDKVTGGKNPKRGHINRGPVVGAMFDTFLKDSVACFDFWESIALCGSFPETPQRVLETYLLNTAVRGGDLKKAATPREMFVKCLHAWNAFRKNRSTDLRYQPALQVPAVL